MPRINTEYREDAKKKIIAAALEVVAEKGWDAVTIEAIAQRVGVTKGALYTYFENREELLREVSFAVFRNIRVSFEATLADEDDIHKIIRNLAELIFEQQKPYATIFYQLPLRLPQDPSYRKEFLHIFDNNRILIRDCLARMKAEGKLPQNVDPEAASSTIIAMTIGLRISALFLGKDSDTAKKIWIDSVERILGIGPG
jgi:AcrR family transcriptional regulator